MRTVLLVRSITMFSATGVVSMAGNATAMAMVQPATDSKAPVLSVCQTTAMPGRELTIFGINFSGRSAQRNAAKLT